MTDPETRSAARLVVSAIALHGMLSNMADAGSLVGKEGATFGVAAVDLADQLLDALAPKAKVSK